MDRIEIVTGETKIKNIKRKQIQINVKMGSNGFLLQEETKRIDERLSLLKAESQWNNLKLFLVKMSKKYYNELILKN